MSFSRRLARSSETLTFNLSSAFVFNFGIRWPRNLLRFLNINGRKNINKNPVLSKSPNLTVYYAMHRLHAIPLKHRTCAPPERGEVETKTTSGGRKRGGPARLSTELAATPPACGAGSR